MALPRVRLDERTVFWRTACALFIFSQYISWGLARRRMPPGWRRLFALLMHLPWTVIVSFVIAGLVTLTGAFLVRWIVRPHLARWLGARRKAAWEEGDEMSNHFHLAPN